jgi:hypothetical protein
MRLLPLALLGALLPGFASAQTGGALTPIQRCEQNHQSCVRACTGADAQSCMTNCAATRAHCIQNPSTATQPRR